VVMADAFDDAGVGAFEDSAIASARLKQALWRADPAADSPAAVGVYQVVCGFLAWRAEVRHGSDGLLAGGLPNGGVPLLPLALVVRLVAGVEQQPPVEGAPAVLAAQQGARSRG
jgi:hypothetical protein